MNLSRTRHGTMVHQRDCRFAVSGTPWLWANDRPEREILDTCLYFGYQTCMACKPLPGTVIRKLRKGMEI